MKKENQALQAKLSAARTAPEVQRGKMSASKLTTATNGETAQSLQMAQLKQDLYEDLTGLIIRNIDKHDNAAVYDCLQTGCNGSKSSLTS
jgi:Chromosome segregation protein Csm1/Pcs1